MVVTLGQQYNVGDKPTVMLYTHINRLGDAQKVWVRSAFSLKTKTKDTMSLDYSSVCNIGSREIYYLVMGAERYILARHVAVMVYW